MSSIERSSQLKWTVALAAMTPRLKLPDFEAGRVSLLSNTVGLNFAWRTPRWLWSH